MKTANKIMMPNGEEIGINGLDGKLTNCLLEVPQRVKLELNDGVLTLKAGSQVIVPNGFEEDGVTPRFDYVDVESDLTYVLNYSTTDKIVLMWDVKYSVLGTERLSIMSSGTTPSNYDQYGTWYDTNANIVKYTNDSGATWISSRSLPIAILDTNGADTIASIDQVFNGLGYIGSTVWVDKGVKGLIPNGRNEDGTLRNIEFTTPKVMTKTESVNGDGNFLFGAKTSDDSVWSGITTSYTYDGKENLLNKDNIRLICGEYTLTNGVITSFQPKQPFIVPDIQDVVRKTGDTMTGALDVTNSFQVINPNVTKGTNPSKDTYWGIMLNGNNKTNTWQSKRLAVMEACAKTDGSVSLTIGSVQNTTDATTMSSLNLIINSSGQKYFSFPMCTTKATTTSSAATNRVAVVVQNYVNGTTWFRVWSDGWVEQGGNAGLPSSGTTGSVTLPKAFSNTNYTIVAGDCFVNSSEASGAHSVGIAIRSASKFDLKSSGTGTGVRWYACGY